MSQYWPSEKELKQRIDKLEAMLIELREGLKYLGAYPEKAKQ